VSKFVINIAIINYEELSNSRKAENHSEFKVLFYVTEKLTTAVIGTPNDFPRDQKNSVHTVTRYFFNTLRTGDADLRFYITTVQDG